MKAKLKDTLFQIGNADYQIAKSDRRLWRAA
jgi:hypothetical protein